MNYHEDADIHNAASMLSNLLPRQAQKQATYSPPVMSRSPQHEATSSVQQVEHEVLITNQPYRTTPLVLPHAKTIHDVGEAQKTLASLSTENPRPYRNSSLAMAAPRTINETGIGAGPYRPYRGPQYYTDRKPVEKNPVSYNSPIRLYGKEALAEAEADQAKQANAAQNELSAPAQESATHQMVIERELTGRPDSQISNSSDRWRSTQDPVMKDSSINQSNSFKKVMYAVMGDSDF